MLVSPATQDQETQVSLGTLLDYLEDSVVVIDKQFRIAACNREAQRVFSIEFEPPSGVGQQANWRQAQCFSVLHGRSEACPACPLKLRRYPDTATRMAFRAETSTCPQRWFEETVHPFGTSDLGFDGAVLHIKDVTHHKTTEILLREEVRRRRLLMAHSRDGIVVLDERGKVFEANRQFARMLGYSTRELLNLHVWDWDVKHSREQLLHMIRAVDTTGDHFETLHRRKDGSLYAAEISSNGVRLGGQKYVLSICRDITEKKLLEEQIRELAIRDPLTDLYNRRFIFERLTQLTAEFLRGTTNFSVSLFDLDHFKMVNDLYGHRAGDAALREFSQLLADSVRQSDLVGRYGGEEFVIVATIDSPGDTRIIIDRILARVRAHPFVVAGHTIRISASCGIAESFEFAREDFSAEALLAAADHRLYQAKESGRDHAVGPEPLISQAPLFYDG